MEVANREQERERGHRDEHSGHGEQNHRNEHSDHGGWSGRDLIVNGGFEDNGTGLLSEAAVPGWDNPLGANLAVADVAGHQVAGFVLDVFTGPTGAGEISQTVQARTGVEYVLRFDQTTLSYRGPIAPIEVFWNGQQVATLDIGPAADAPPGSTQVWETRTATVTGQDGPDLVTFRALYTLRGPEVAQMDNVQLVAAHPHDADSGMFV